MKERLLKEAGWKKPIGMLAASALTVAALAPAAFATTDAETTATLKASDQNLSVTAPLVIPFALGADSAFTAPSADAAVIDNDSVFPVAVTSFEFDAKAGTPMTKDEAATTGEANAWWATMAPNEGEPIAMNAPQSELTDQWNLGLDGDGDTIQLSCAGGMANPDGTIGIGSAQTLGTITWHFAAGANEKAAVHVHDWVAQYEQTWVVDQEAWVEENVPVDIWKCLECGAKFDSAQAAGDHQVEMMLQGDFSHNGTVITEYKDVYHEEVGHWEQKLTGYECSECGETVAEIPEGGDGQ